MPGNHQTTWPCSAPRLRSPPAPYPSTYWMVQRLTSRRLASSRWVTPFDRFIRMYSRCCSVGLGPSARETAFGPRLRLARNRTLLDRVSPRLAEGEHYRELELAVGHGRVKVFRQRPELHSHPVQTHYHL